MNTETQTGGALARAMAAASLGLAALLLFYRLGDAPLSVWDEARVATSALEMAGSGLSWVTTYAGAADHWNTKPPLLIWLMALSIQLFGASEGSARLPSAIAGVLTAAIVHFFVSVRLQRPLVGFVSVVLLLSMKGYLLNHGARSSDYESLLTLLSTGYVMAGYLSTQTSARTRTGWLVACFAMVLLAFLTKTVQGLIFLPPVLAYLLVFGPGPLSRRLLEMLAGLVAVSAAAAAFYLVREQVDPGYLAATLGNDFGRFRSVPAGGNAGGLFWYVTRIENYPLLIPAALSAIVLSLRATGEERRLVRYLALLAAFYLAVISVSSTKFTWYLTPIAPAMALLTALGLGAVWRQLPLGRVNATARKQNVGLVVAVVGALLIAAVQIHRIDFQARHMQSTGLDRVNVFMRSMAGDEATGAPLVVVHPGYPNGHGDSYYIAPALFYATVLRQTRPELSFSPSLERVNPAASFLVACDVVLPAGPTLGFDLEPVRVDGPCGLYRVRSRFATGQSRPLS